MSFKMAGCLEDYLARAWAIHIHQLDGSLSLDERIACLDPREVMATFVGYLGDYQIPPDEIHERTIQELVYSLSPCYLRPLLLQSYAECILVILKNVKCDHCVGCNYGPMGHPSQRHHSCLGAADELLDLYFSECLEILDRTTLMTKYTEKLYDFDYAINPDAELRRLITHELGLLPVTCTERSI